MLVVLIGYRGTGKSTVGRLLAARLRLPFADSDLRIQEHTGKTVADIFAEEGEAGFRDWESSVIVQLARHFRGVLSLGGGAVLRPENVAALRPPGIFVWLQASPETIAVRVTSDPNTKNQRPQLTDRSGLDEITHVLTEREPIYRECADIIVDTRDKSPGQVVDDIVAALPKWDSEHDLSK